MAQSSVLERLVPTDVFALLSPDVACTFGLDGILRWTSARWFEMPGRTRTRLPRKRYLHYIHLDDRAATTAAISLAAATGQLLDQHENRFRTAGGDIDGCCGAGW